MRNNGEQLIAAQVVALLFQLSTAVRAQHGTDYRMLAVWGVPWLLLIALPEQYWYPGYGTESLYALYFVTMVLILLFNSSLGPFAKKSD